MQSCSDTTEAKELFEPQGLFLKPLARVSISVQLPELKTPGQTISNWEVMEKIKTIVRPDTFLILKVVKSTLEFIRFEGEAENKAALKNIISRLDHHTIKLSGFPDTLRVRAAEAKITFPTRHDWDSFFRDVRNMNDMKPGERPDTVHLQLLPCRWFANKKGHDLDKPSEYIVKKVFEVFGEIRCVDIPTLDPYRCEINKSTGTIHTFSFGQDLTFEAYVQYKDYMGFVTAMNALKGMKLMHKGDDGKCHTAAMKVDFDRSKHLCEASIRKRQMEREKLIQLEKEREERVSKERLEEERRKEDERKRLDEEERERERHREEKLLRKEERKREREAKRKRKIEELKRIEHERVLSERKALEDRKTLLAERRIGAHRLLSVLFQHVKEDKELEEWRRNLDRIQQEEMEMQREKERRDAEEQAKRQEEENSRRRKLAEEEERLRQKLLLKMRTKEEQLKERRREKIRKGQRNKNKLKSAILVSKWD